MLDPVIPHTSFALWQDLGHQDPVDSASWPEADSAALVQDSRLIVVQVNGKVRNRITVAADTPEEDIKNQALSDETVKKFTDGKSVKKVIYVKDKLVNIVAV